MPGTLHIHNDTVKGVPMPSTTSIHDIQSLVAARMGVTVCDIVSARQTRSAVTPRHVAMWLARHCTTASLPAIGFAFGNRDHTTVINAVRRIDDRMEADAELRGTVRALVGMLSVRRVAA